jgi:hypothetical protein
MRGLAALEYCTDEGGSGFISDATVPTMSTFDITQLSPVYDQEMGWLRNTTRPGAYTVYPDYYPAGEAPELVRTGCSGIGDLVLRRADVVAPLPSITGAARSNCEPVTNLCGGDVGSWIEDNPWLAALIVAIGAVALFGGARK